MSNEEMAAKIDSLELENERLREEVRILQEQSEEDASQMATLEDEVRYWKAKAEGK